MPQPLSWYADSRGGPVVVTVSGTVDERSGPGLHHALTRCLRNDPVALVVELSGATVASREAAQIFPELIDHADLWPGTPVLLAGPDAASAALITKALGDGSPVYATVAAAVATLAHDHEIVSEIIDPVRGAARRARGIVTEACRAWDLPHLITPAVLVVSELVTNAVMHAGSVMTLQVKRRPRYLYLAVFDDAAAEPSPREPGDTSTPGGRGLRIVDLACARWGHRREGDGKVVWASFATGSAD